MIVFLPWHKVNCFFVPLKNTQGNQLRCRKLGVVNYAKCCAKAEESFITNLPDLLLCFELELAFY